MQRILDLIEATLDAEFTPAELAERSGYSLWHFLHLFQREVGMPLGRYIAKRRLAHGIYDVSRGMNVTDAAMKWGFGSHSGFFRAFRREYGMSPTAWMKTHRVNAPCVPLLKEEVFKMLSREKFREALTHWGLDLPCPDDEPYADHLLNWALPRVRDVLPDTFPADFADRLSRLWELPVTIVHRDPNPSNLIDDGEHVGFIDFDLSRRFVRIFDPCYLMTAVLSETFGREDLPWRENWPVLFLAVRAGYSSVSPLTEEEEAAAPTMIIGNELLALAAFAGSSKYRDVFDVNLRMLPYILENLPV